MAYLKELEDKIKDYLKGDYEITETKTIPSPENVPLGKKAFKIKLTAFCIDLRKSTDLLRIHDKETCGKIHKSFLTISTKIITANGGQIRSFNGDSVLAFFPAQLKSDIGSAIRAAFQLKWALNIKFAPLFKEYTVLDFCIGIDWGDVHIVKAGLPKNDNNNDLVFLGMCVNYATAIANQGYGPNHIEISTITYDNLPDDWKYGTSNGVKQDMWSNGTINWKGQKWDAKLTSWYQEITE
jgi:adenylate cyclase